MKKIFLDTETTDLNPGQIAQLSYIIQDDKLVRAKNFFLKVKEVKPGAEAIHGFSKEKLDLLSGGKRFSDISHEVLQDFAGATIIMHNAGFDYNRFLTAEFKWLGIPILHNTFCTMQHFTPICMIPGRYGNYKWPRLSELMDFLGISPTMAMENAKIMYGCDDISFHDARFDSTGLFMCYAKAFENGYLEAI